MNRIKEICDNNIPVNWGTLWTAWKGLRAYPPLIGASDVIEFAVDKLGSEKAVPDPVLRLASLYQTETDKVRELLFSLSKSNPYDPETEERKWRLIILMDLLGHLPKDPMYAVLELADFWSTWDFPADSPISGININEFYDKQGVEKLFSSHAKWIENEKRALAD